MCVWESKKWSEILIFSKKSRNISPSLYSYLIEVVHLAQILCHRIVEPHGLSVNFFGVRQSLSALLNICNEASLGSFSIGLSPACLFQHNAGRWQKWLKHLQSSWHFWINILLLAYPAFYLYNPISQITNLPQGALQSACLTPSILRPSIRIRKKLFTWGLKVMLELPASAWQHCLCFI